MKIKGEVIGRPVPSEVLIERGDKSYLFKLQAVLSLDGFDAIYPEPQPKVRMEPGKQPEKIFGPEYEAALTTYYTARANWIILQSLAATEGLTWETVDMQKPSTYANFHKELAEAGLTRGEINYLIGKVNDANGLDERKMQEALERFHRTQEAATANKS